MRPLQGLADDRLEQVGHLEGIHRLVDGADAGERVRQHEPVVEARHGQAGHEGVYPQGEARQLDGERVDVEAVDAAAGDLTAQQLRLGDRLGRLRVGTERLASLLGQALQLGTHRRNRGRGEEVAHAALDLVDRRDQEVRGPHREVGDPEVEEQLSRLALAPFVHERLHALEVRVERRLDRALDKVVDDDLRRVVRAGGLALTGGGVEVGLAGSHDDLLALRRGQEDAVLVDGEVRLGEGERRFEQTFVNGAELAHLQRAEVDRARHAVLRLLGEHRLQGGAHHVVGQLELLEQGALVARRVEQAATVGGDLPPGVADRDGIPDLGEVAPDRRRLLGELARIGGELALDERPQAVGVVVLVAARRQQLGRLTVRLEEQAEQDAHAQLVGELEPLGVDGDAELG